MEQNFTYRTGGTNTFMPDASDTQKPGQSASLRSAASSSICRADGDRLLDRQLLSAAVGHGLLGAGLSPIGAFRTARAACACRRQAASSIAPSTAMVNPYLMAAALLKAIDDGLRRNLDPGEPEERNIYQAMEEGKAVKKLPMTLGEALERWRTTRSSSRRCRTRCTASSRTIRATNGSGSWPHVDRMGSRGPISIVCRDQEGTETTMCGIAGLIHRGRRERHRPGDDGDASVPEASRPGLDGLCALWRLEAERICHALQGGRAGRSPYGFHIREQIKERSAEVDQRLAELGANHRIDRGRDRLRQQLSSQVTRAI